MFASECALCYNGLSKKELKEELVKINLELVNPEIEEEDKNESMYHKEYIEDLLK